MTNSFFAPSRRPAAIALALAILVALPACSDGEATPSAAPSDADASAGLAGPVRQTRDSVAIGVALNPSRPGMQSVYNGVLLAVDALNAARAEGARPFSMRRTAATMTSAVQVAEELRGDRGVVAVVGHPESGASLESIPIFEDVINDGANALAAVSPTATSPALSGKSRWFFRVCPSDEAASRAVAQFVVDSLRARRAAVIYRNDSYGRDWTKTFAAAYRAGGGELVQRDPYLPGMTEWAAYAAYMRQLGAEVLLFPGNVEDAELAIRALRAIGANDIAFIGGDAASALEEKASEFAGARYTAFFDARRPTSPAARAFIKEYRDRFGSVPDQRAALSYDAAMLIGAAVGAVGPDRAKVRDWLEQVGRTNTPHEGVAGRIAFDPNHDAVAKPVIVATVRRP
jgi:branched-chain amino acid transport system substrate-binding protein